MEADLEKLKHTGEFAVFVSPGVDIYISIRIRVNSPSKALSMVSSGGSNKNRREGFAGTALAVGKSPVPVPV